MLEELRDACVRTNAGGSTRWAVRAASSEKQSQQTRSAHHPCQQQSHKTRAVRAAPPTTAADPSPTWVHAVERLDELARLLERHARALGEARRPHAVDHGVDL